MVNTSSHLYDYVIYFVNCHYSLRNHFKADRPTWVANDTCDFILFADFAGLVLL